MPKQWINPASLFSSVPHGFSQVVIATGAKTVFISGQSGWDANKQIAGPGVAEQAQQALRNVQAAVEAAGGGIHDIVALRIYVVGDVPQHTNAIGGALKECFATNPPTTTWIGVSSLAVAHFLVEIEAVAVLD